MNELNFLRNGTGPLMNELNLGQDHIVHSPTYKIWINMKSGDTNSVLTKYSRQ